MPQTQSTQHQYTPFSYNNNVSFGYNQTPFIDRLSAQDQFFFKIGRCERPVLDWRSECLLAAEEITNLVAMNFDKPIAILLSGGVDSEIVAESFRLFHQKSGVKTKNPIHFFIVRFLNDLNQHDIQWAVKYYEKHRFDFEFLDFDIMSFYQGVEQNDSELIQLMKLVNCPYPMILAQLKMIELLHQKNYFVITGSLNPCFQKMSSGEWKFYAGEQICSLYRFQMKKNIQGLMSFFKWRPEMFVAFAKDSLVQKIFRNEVQGFFGSSEDFKVSIYSQYFDVAERPKYRGYEKFNDLHKQITNKLLHLLNSSFDQQHFWTMDEILGLE